MRIVQNRIIMPLAILISIFVGIDLFSQAKQSPRAPQPATPSRALWAGFSSAELLRQLDADQDGTISRDEWERFFKDHDVNADGRLSAEELQSFLRKGADEDSLGPDYGRLAAFERLDTNKNNVIDRSEWPGKEKDFRMLDADHNGSVSREEFLARAGRWWNEPFENLDFNGDGLISRSEWLDSDASLDRLDRDHNGVIDRKEFYDPR
jgi:Ca2+-binding EF-hand superfamily protein